MWLVTGATGLVGNNVVRELVNRGEPVRALVRGEKTPTALADLPIEIAYGDVCTPAAVRGAMQGVRYVVHAAGLTDIGWSGLDRHRQVNVEGTRNITEAARSVQARLVYVSSIDALGVNSNGQPVDESTATDVLVPCAYVVSKREAEIVVLDEIERGLDATVVNPGFMLGPWDWKPSSGKILFEVANGWARLVPPGSNSCCDVRDVAAAIVTAAERQNRVRRYILAGESISYRNACQLFAQITGGPRPIRTARNRTLRAIGWVGDLYGRLRGREGKVNSAVIALSMLEKNYSSAKAERELGYRTRPLVESARDAWAWLQQYRNGRK